MPSRQLSSTLMPIAHLSRCDHMPIIMLITPAGQLTAPIAVGRSHAIPGSSSRPIRRPSAWRSRGDKTPGSLPDCLLTLKDSPKALEIPVTPVFVAEGLSHNFWPLDPRHPVYQAW